MLSSRSRKRPSQRTRNVKSHRAPRDKRLNRRGQGWRSGSAMRHRRVAMTPSGMPTGPHRCLGAGLGGADPEPSTAAVRRILDDVAVLESTHEKRAAMADRIRENGAGSGCLNRRGASPRGEVGRYFRRRPGHPNLRRFELPSRPGNP